VTKLSYLQQFPTLKTYVLDMFVAAQRSKVTRKKMGSIILQHTTGQVWQILSDGCNGVASGSDHVFEVDGITLPEVIHSEINAIKKANFSNIPHRSHRNKSVEKFGRCVMLVMSTPCINCSQAIIKTGKIDHVIFVDSYRVQAGLELLDEAGITWEQVSAMRISELLETQDQIKFELMVSRFQQNFLLRIQNFITAAHVAMLDEKDLNELNLFVRGATLYNPEEDFGEFCDEMNPAYYGASRYRSLRYGMISVAELLKERAKTYGTMKDAAFEINNKSIGEDPPAVLDVVFKMRLVNGIVMVVGFNSVFQLFVAVDTKEPSLKIC
jgi:deoxycytidylate deaminase